MSNHNFAKFDSRKTYFDDLGNKITGAQDSATAIKLAKLDFEVVKQPIFVQSPLRKVKDQFATIRTDTKDVLGIVGKNYNILQNQEAFNFIDSIVEGGAQIETGGVYRKTAATFITARTEPITILGDQIDPYMLFMNSFDGSGTVRGMFTPIRVFCSNCLVIAVKKSMNSFSIRHSNSLVAKLDQAKQILLQNTKYLEELNRRSELLAATPFSKEDFEKMGKELFPIADGVSLCIGQRQEVKLETLMNAYNQPDLQNFNGTAYKALQAVSDYESHQPKFRDTQNPYANMQTVILGMPLLNQVFARLSERVSA